MIIKRASLVRLCAVLLPFLVLEGIGRVIDARSDFSDEVTRTLAIYDISKQPQSPYSQTASPGTIWIRADEGFETNPKRAVMGNQFIEGTTLRSLRKSVTPEDLNTNSKKKVFVIGESNAFGKLYAFHESFAAQLDQMVGPHGYEVFNAAEPASTSEKNVSLVRTIVRSFDPSVLILLMGNNIWINWTVPQQTWMNPALLASLRLLSTSRAAGGMIYLWLRYLAENQDELRQRLTGSFRIHHDPNGVDYALQHPLENKMTWEALDWPNTKQMFLRSFGSDLREMLNEAKKNGVRVVLLTNPYSYKLSPAWKHPQPESTVSAHRTEVRQFIQQAAELMRARKCTEALQVIQDALTIDVYPAILHHMRGMCFEQLGKFLDAEHAYAQSRENMVGNLGSVLSINKVIKAVATETGTTVIDVQQLFDDYEHAHGRYFNVDFIRDDCHPTPLGHQLIAGALARVLQKQNP